MAKNLNYNSREYDELLVRARHVGWNEDGLDSDDHRKAVERFNASLDENYSNDSNIERLKRTSRGEVY